MHSTFLKLKLKLVQFLKALTDSPKLMCLYPKIALKMLWDKYKKRKIVVYHLSSPGHVQYHLPTFKHLQKNNLPICFYIAQDYNMVNQLRDFNLPKSHFFPAPLAKYLPMINVFIEGEVHGRGPQKAIKIFTGHGYPTKRAKWQETDLKAFDYYFFYGPLERELFKEIQKQHPQASSHLITCNIGYPKLDEVLNHQQQKKEILNTLGLNPNYPTVLFAPAWDPGGALRTHGLKIPEQILSLPKINLIVKLHPANLEPPHSPNFNFYTGGVNWREEFARLQHHKNFKFIDRYSINSLLIASDIMITDFSGVALEFMTQNKPVLFIDCPQFYQETLINEGCDPHLAKHDDRFNGGRNAGKVIYKLEDLNQEILNSLKFPEELESLRIQMSQKFLYNPGKGTDFESNKIIELLKVDSA